MNEIYIFWICFLMFWVLVFAAFMFIWRHEAMKLRPKVLIARGALNEIAFGNYNGANELRDKAKTALAKMDGGYPG